MGCGSSITDIKTFNDQNATHPNHGHQRDDRSFTLLPLGVSTQTRCTQTEGDIEKSTASSSTFHFENENNDDATWLREYIDNLEKKNRCSIDITHFHFFELPKSGKEIFKAELHEEKARIKEEKRASYKLGMDRGFGKKYHVPQSNITSIVPTNVNLSESVKAICKAELHEQKARKKQEIRDSFKRRQDKLIMMLRGFIITWEVIPTVPKVETVQSFKMFTVDDGISRYSVGKYFKYGREIYSNDKVAQCLQVREREILEYRKFDYYTRDRHRIWNIFAELPGTNNLRYYLLSRDEFSEILAYSHVGTFVDLPHEEYMSRMKQSVENLLEEPCECTEDQKSQLLRWLSSYPNSETFTVSVNVDANQQEFPLPSEIKADPTVLRQWTEDWEPFDLEIPDCFKGGWCEISCLLDEDWDSCHEINEETDGNTIGPFEDMSIDGDAAWDQLPQDVIKNDVTTPSQDLVWIARAKRTNINDPVWQTERRKQLGDALKTRRDGLEPCCYSCVYDCDTHVRFAARMQEDWAQFQNVCAQPFVPPTGHYRITKPNSNLQP